MNKLSAIITRLALLKAGPTLSPDERAAVGCAIQVLNDVERLGITVDAYSKDYYHLTHPGKKK
ncbi:MAG: hypothetical protein WC373_04615 [Smithella sp.]